ncbi:MAG TPA: hypothetical protein VMT17_16205 [Anaeromyxobacteraceae bacterium]|nr:hypothetical protein [Anaeromyxobacteraceae bacterium]
MALEDPERILELLRDPNVDSHEVAAQTGTTREDAAKAARLLVGLAKATPDEVATLPGLLSAALVRAAVAGGRGDLLSGLASSADRAVAKEAKRGLHVLRSRGIDVPEPARPPAPAAPPPAEESFPSFASAVDSNGERAVWIARNVAGRGIEVGQAVVSDVLGLLELQIGLLGRKEFRAFARDVAERGRSMGVAEVNPAVARSLVAAARRLNEASGRRVPEGAEGWLARLGPAEPLPDPAAGFPALPEAEERAAVDASADLHDLPMLRGWLADEATLRALAQRLDEVAVSPLYIDEQQRAAQVASTIADAVDSYFDGPRRSRLSARLFTTAAHLQGLGDDAHARSAAAVARALLAGVPAGQIPFARLLVEKAFPSSPPRRAPADPGGPVIVPR